MGLRLGTKPPRPSRPPVRPGESFSCSDGRRPRPAWVLVLVGLVAAGAVYVAAAVETFHWRHPWMTDRECELYILRALRWERVPYDVARPR